MKYQLPRKNNHNLKKLSKVIRRNSIRRRCFKSHWKNSPEVPGYARCFIVNNKFRYSVLFVLWRKKLIVTLEWSRGLWNEGVAPKRCLWQPYIRSNRISQNLIWLKLVTYQHISKKNYRNLVCCWRKWMWTWYRLLCLHVNRHCLIFVWESRKS